MAMASGRIVSSPSLYPAMPWNLFAPPARLLCHIQMREFQVFFFSLSFFFPVESFLETPPAGWLLRNAHYICRHSPQPSIAQQTIK